MELPREDLLRLRRRGDYQGYAVALCGVSEHDDPFLKVAAVNLKLGEAVLGATKAALIERGVMEFGTPEAVDKLARMAGEPPGLSDELAAEIFECAHLRDLFTAIKLDAGPALGDLPEGGGAVSLRLIAVGAYDLILLDGVVGWITDDAGMSEKDSDILVRGEPSTINRKALMRGFRLWELRQLLLPGANLLAYLYQDFSVNRRYTYAKNGTSKAKVLTRVAHMAAWSPMRQALLENATLKKHWEQIQRQRPHDVWTRERLREHWSDLERQAVEMQRQGIRDSQIAKKLRLNQATVKDWLRP